MPHLAGERKLAEFGGKEIPDKELPAKTLPSCARLGRWDTCP